MGSHCFLGCELSSVTLNKLFDSGDQAWPALGVALAILGHWRQTAVGDLDLGATGDRGQLPTDDRLMQWVGMPAREPGIFQHSRGIEFENLAMMDEIGVGMFA